MNFKHTVRFGMASLLAVGALALTASHVQAQPPGGGGFQPTPEMKAKMEAWQKYRENHKNLTGLQTLLMQIRGMEKESPELQLDKSQSTKMLAILKDWGPKKELTEDQAKDVTKKINAFLTDKQVKKMSTIRGFGGGGRPGGGAPGGGGGGPRPGGGAPGAGGAGGFKIPDPPKGSYNPLNPDTAPEQFRPQAKKAMTEFTASLQKRAKG